MVLHFRAGEELRTVQIERSGEGYRARLDGRSYAVVVRGVQGPRLDLLIDGRPLQALAVAAGDRRIVKIDGADPVTLERALPHRARARPPVPGEETQTAPMDGQVTSVLVQDGQEVQAGTLLVVLEAMKMEFRMVAPFAGRVKRVACAPGEVVERGRLLLELEPSA